MNFEEIMKLIVRRRNELKKNTIIAITGDTGEGKSYAALRIAEIIDPEFDPEKQIIYNPKNLLERIEEAKEKKYKVLILDEAHVTVPARLWYSLTNIAIHFVLTTFRQLHRLTVIIVTPSIEEIDISLRRLLNYYFIVKRTTSRYAYLFPYEIYINRFTLLKQETLIKRLILIIDKKIYRIKTIKLKQPSLRIREKYEEMSKKFKAELLRKQIIELESKLKKGDEEVKKTIDEVLAFLFENKRLLNMSFRRKRDGTIKLNRSMFKRMFKFTEEDLYELEARLFEELKKQNLI